MELKKKGGGGREEKGEAPTCTSVTVFFVFHLSFRNANIKFIKRFVRVSADSWLHVRTLIKESRVRNKKKDCD